MSEGKFVQESSSSSSGGPPISDNDVWEIIVKKFKEYAFIQMQTASFNEFLSEIPNIIEGDRINAEGGYLIEFGQVHLGEPRYREITDQEHLVTPKECIDRDISYMSRLYADITVHPPEDDTLGSGKKREPRHYAHVHIGEIPVMVKSQVCNLYKISNDPSALAELHEDVYDQGGYFIVKGSPKIIASRQSTAYNMAFTYKDRKQTSGMKYELYTEVRSISKRTSKTTTVCVGMKGDLLSVSVPYIKSTAIPLIVLFRALGIENNRDIINHIPGVDVEMKKLLEPSFEQAYECYTQEAALHYIGKQGKKFSNVIEKEISEEEEEEVEDEDLIALKKDIENDTRSNAISYATHLLSSEFIPHLGVGKDSFVKKRFFLGYMTGKLLEVHLGRRSIEDRDHYANKRIDTPGILLRDLFHATAWKRFKSEISKRVVQEGSHVFDIKNIIKTTTIGSIMCSALSSNIWGNKLNTNGTSQTFDRFNYTAGIANSRKFKTPMNEGGKIEIPRQLHNSHWGGPCPSETPEGKTCLTLDTLIETPMGQIPIGKLKNGDEVISVDEDLFISVTKIYDFFIIEKPTLTINWHGRQITATRDHPFLVNCEWVECGDLKVGDMLTEITNFDEICTKSCQVNITSIIENPEKIKVADFTTVSENHSFIANGIVTHNCGLVTNASMQCIITSGSDPINVIEILNNMGIITFDEVTQDTNLLNLVKVFVNGDLIGVTRHPHNIVGELRMLRRNSCLFYEVSISYNTITREIHILTEAGRICRALMIVERGEIRLRKSHIEEIKRGEWDVGPGSAWVRLLDGGYVEFVDKLEEESMLISTYPSDLQRMDPEKRAKITHCELHPSLIYGVGASLIPFPDHNQSPRNTYQAAMGKQAIGVPGSNFMFQTKGKFHVMNNPQKPLVSTKMSKIIGFDKLPAGQNAIVAICPWYGFGQEDSIIMNQDSIDRGFMNITTHLCFTGKARVNKNEMFEIPIEGECNDYKGNPSKLDPLTGIICEGQIVEEGDILIGCTSPADNGPSIHRKMRTNISVLYDHPWPGKVHLVQKGTDGKGFEYVHVVVAQQRPPVFGDKFAARHGQKGTVGMLYRSNDLPFTEGGVAPDILVNPLAFPSRMTVGMWIEMIQGKKVASSSILHSLTVDKAFRIDKKDYVNPKDKIRKGKNKGTAFKTDGDATPFEKDFSLKKITDELKSMGINEFSDERMINGQTGEYMDCLIFNGVCYYQRLKHMVIDKIHARSRGGRTRMTRQPREGRRIGGGFKVGHMERDCEALGTPVALAEGLSVPIEQLERFENVFGWSGEGVEKSEQTNFAYKGILPQFTITLQDGRKNNATANHPFLSENGEWTDLEDIEEGERLACSVRHPSADFKKESRQVRKWLINKSVWSKKMFAALKGGIPSHYEVFRRWLALARLIGWAVTDSHIPKKGKIELFFGHLLDIESANDDIERLIGERLGWRMIHNSFALYLPVKLSNRIRKFGMGTGARVAKNVTFPKFIRKDTPVCIIREFLGGMFGGDGHTVCLGVHRGKRDLMRSVAISWSRNTPKTLASLQEYMQGVRKLLERCGVHGSTIQKPKLTAAAKRSNGKKNQKEIVLAVPISSLVTFSENVGFRYCVHKTQRLDAGASYRRFREGVLRQRQWIVDRTDEICNYRERKENGEAKIDTKKAVQQAAEELKIQEPLLHPESVPTTKMFGRLALGKSNNEIRSTTFPTAEQYLVEIGAIDFFSGEVDSENPQKICYGVSREETSIPPYYLKVIDVRRNGKEKMYDITVDKTESFVANGFISHNCLLGQGAPWFTKDRLMEQSDESKFWFCKICGLPASKTECRVCESNRVSYVKLPYATKLAMQELAGFNVIIRLLTTSYGEPGDTAYITDGKRIVGKGMIMK